MAGGGATLLGMHRREPHSGGVAGTQFTTYLYSILPLPLPSLPTSRPHVSPLSLPQPPHWSVHPHVSHWTLPLSRPQPPHWSVYPHIAHRTLLLQQPAGLPAAALMEHPDQPAAAVGAAEPLQWGIASGMVHTYGPHRAGCKYEHANGWVRGSGGAWSCWALVYLPIFTQLIN